MTQTLSFVPDSPLADDLTLLFDRHAAEMHADTPPESIHMMPRETLVSPDVDFFVLRRDGVPMGMAALKRLDAAHGRVVVGGAARLSAGNAWADSRKNQLSVTAVPLVLSGITMGARSSVG